VQPRDGRCVAPATLTKALRRAMQARTRLALTTNDSPSSRRPQVSRGGPTYGASRGRRSASRVMLPNYMYRVSAIIATVTSSAGGEAAVSQPAQQNPLWRLLLIRLISQAGLAKLTDRRLVTGEI
jgi:hypothetical protein